MSENDSIKSPRTPRTQAIVEAKFRVGAVFGRLVVIEAPTFVRPEKGKARWFCKVRCSCGTEKVSLCQNVEVAGSCGCLKREKLIAANTKHGGSRSKLYHVYQGMLTRCYDSKHKKFHRYGGRGVTVCEEWRESFAKFRLWAMSSGWKDDLQIDRRNNDGAYCPENCRIVTRSQNNRNKSDNHLVTAFGETKCLEAWVEDCRCVVSKGTLYSRLRYGWDFVRALVTPTIQRSECWKMVKHRRNQWTGPYKRSTAATSLFGSA